MTTKGRSCLKKVVSMLTSNNYHLDNWLRAVKAMTSIFTESLIVLDVATQPSWVPIRVDTLQGPPMRREASFCTRIFSLAWRGFGTVPYASEEVEISRTLQWIRWPPHGSSTVITPPFCRLGTSRVPWWLSANLNLSSYEPVEMVKHSIGAPVNTNMFVWAWAGFHLKTCA